MSLKDAIENRAENQQNILSAARKKRKSSAREQMIRRQHVSELTFEIDFRKKRGLDYMDLDNELQYLTYLISETEQINPSA